MIGPRSIAVVVATVAVGVASASAHAAEVDARPTAAAAQSAVTCDQSTMLSRVDAAFASGALTFREARALYQEQAAIRAAWIDAKARGDRHAVDRVRFMLRTSQASLARLTYNHTRRVEIPLWRVATAE